MSIQGSLDDLPLPNVIQLVSMSGKTGAFVLKSENRAGEIFLRDGELVHAHLGSLSGEDAFYEFAVWESGEFTFHEHRETDQQTIRKSSTSLLMEAARRIDEWQVLSKRVPSTQLVPVMASQAWSSTSDSFSPQEWSVICTIDGGRTIEEIAAVLEVAAFEVAKLLYGLVTSGVVKLEEPSGQRYAGRLRQMSRSELEITARRVHVQAMMLLAGHAETSEVEAMSGRTLAQIQSGHGVDAVLEMIGSVEQIVASALGPVKARAFAQQLDQQLAGSP